MRVELQVDLRPERRPSTAKPVVDAEARAEKQRLAREDRRLRQIALARLIEERIAVGQFASLADVARRCGVSRARVSQVMAVPRSVEESITTNLHRPKNTSASEAIH